MSEVKIFFSYYADGVVLWPKQIGIRFEVIHHCLNQCTITVPFFSHLPDDEADDIGHALSVHFEWWLHTVYYLFRAPHIHRSPHTHATPYAYAQRLSASHETGLAQFIWVWNYDWINLLFSCLDIQRLFPLRGLRCFRARCFAGSERKIWFVWSKFNECETNQVENAYDWFYV